MAQLNRWTGAGHLGKDPESNYTEGGTLVLNFSMATNDGYFKDEEWHDRTFWHRVAMFGQRAERIQPKLHKGTFVLVEGPMQTRSWEDKDGNKRYTTECVAQRVQLLEKSSDRQDPTPPDDKDIDPDLPF